jgi:hypothetical protein
VKLAFVGTGRRFRCIPDLSGQVRFFIFFHLNRRGFLIHCAETMATSSNYASPA